MASSHSKPSVSCASPPLSEPRSPPTASGLADETRDGVSGLPGVPACIPPSEAAGPLRKRLRSAVLEDDGDAKRIKDVGSGVVPDIALLNDDGQFQLASAGRESLLLSSHPLGAASDLLPGASESAHGQQPVRSFELDGAQHKIFHSHARDMVLGPSGSVNSLQLMRPFKLDGAKHKIFFSHSGAQKDFVDQLCVDLERLGYIFPFFDKRHHSLPKGHDFAPLIIEAARLCHVAVIVLSEEFLCSKWPMIELATIYASQQDVGVGGSKPILLPLFFKLSVEEVKNEGHWMPKWKEHAKSDNRIDLSVWSAAVKALCKSNGFDFEEVGRKEVAYREWITKSIFKFSPPDLLFGISKSMVGCDRMCEAMSIQFVEDPIVGAGVLAIYGMTGLGKSMLSKAMHDYFFREFLGKVCYVDMRKGLRARRQEWMLKVLCGFDKDVVDFLGDDVEKGLEQMKTFIKRERVFLIIDNITNGVDLLQEVQDYLMMGFHPESRILITSSSKAILKDLLPHMELFTPMPSLTIEESRTFFLERAAPMKAITRLTSEEHNILGICIQKCWFYAQEGGSYHPMALKALADFFSRLGRVKGNQLLIWKDHLEKEMDLAKDVLKSSKDFFGILGLQFSTFDLSEKLLFLDIALYSKFFIHSWIHSHYDIIGRLCRLHDESPTTIKRKLMDLRKSGMINFDIPEDIDTEVVHTINVPHLYKEFAKWYATDHKEIGLKNARGVFQPGGTNGGSNSSTLIKSLSNLVRLRISSMTLARTRLVASKRMQELSNLVVLQLSSCDNLEVLNLEGLNCLHDLELRSLSKLKTITFSGNSSKDEYIGIYDSLQDVRFLDLESLIDLPDLRPCTSLHMIIVEDCAQVRNFERVGCLYMKALCLLIVDLEFVNNQIDFNRLKSLETLVIKDCSNIYSFFYVEWKQAIDESDIGFEIILKGGGPRAKLLEELSSLLYKLNRMICTCFESW